MTWAKTKIESDETDVLTEDEYRRRKAHPNFKEHLALEKEITKAGKKTNLKTYVIAAGLVYHTGESIFHHIFKAAWHNEHALVCYGDGTNTLPCIHLDDLVNITVEVIETTPETKYLIAVDESKSTLLEITKAISENLGSGLVKNVDKEEAFLNKSISQADYDMLTCGLRLDASQVKEMSFEWKFEVSLT
jgi:adenylate kinase